MSASMCCAKAKRYATFSVATIVVAPQCFDPFSSYEPILGASHKMVWAFRRPALSASFSLVALVDPVQQHLLAQDRRVGQIRLRGRR